MKEELTDILPIGSVIILKECTAPLMIIQNKKIHYKEDEKEYQYVGEPFPLGMIDSQMTRFFNQEDINEIIFVGYVDSRIANRKSKKGKDEQ